MRPLRLTQALSSVPSLQRERALVALDTGPGTPEQREAARTLFIAVCLKAVASADDAPAALAPLFEQASQRLESESLFGGALLCEALAHRVAPTPNRLPRMLQLARSARFGEDQVELWRTLLENDRRPDARRAAFLALGKALEDEVRHDEAAETYGHGLTEFPGAPELLTGRARSLEAARRYDELLAVLYEQIAIEKSEPKLALLHTRLGTLLETVLKNDARALEHYRAAIKLSPTFEPPIQSLLALAERKGEWPTVVEGLKLRLRAEVRPKERATVLTRLGEVVGARLKDVPRAVSYLERALREYPRSLPARLLLLEFLVEQRQFARAERFATPPDGSEGQGLSPAQLARLCQMRARVATERDRPREALDCLCLALEVAPKPRPVMEDLLALLRREEPETPPPPVLARKSRDWERTGERALAAMALLAQALLWQACGRVDEAERLLIRAVSLAPDPSSDAEALGELRYRLRRMEEAAQTFLAAAANSPAAEARLTVRAASIIADHLGRPEHALEILRELQVRGAASSESCLLTAALAFAHGRVEEAALALEQAGGWTTPDRQHALQALRVELLRRRNAEPGVVQSALADASRAGNPRALRELAAALLAEGRAEPLMAVVQAIPRERLPEAYRILGDVHRGRGETSRAAEMYYRALEASAGADLDAIEGMALVSPDEALVRLEVLLSTDPFNPRALGTLASLLTIRGDTERSSHLYRLATGFSDGDFGPASPHPERLFQGLELRDPFLLFIRALRQHAPGPFALREEALLSASDDDLWPEPVASFLAAACGPAGLPVPRLRVRPSASAEPVVGGNPAQLAVSAALLQPDFPEGALLFTALRGATQLFLGLSGLGALAPFEVDVLSDALRSAAMAQSVAPTQSPAAQVATLLGIGEDAAAAALAEAATLPGAAAADPVLARVTLDGAILRNVLASTGDLPGALSGLSLCPPPRVAYRATRSRWLRQLGRLPLARAAMGYSLSEHFSKLSSVR